MRLFLSLGAIGGFLGVALGAFAAHGLQKRIDPHMIEIFQKGVQYQMYHIFALLAVGLLLKFFPDMGLFNTAGWFFLAGIILFSGSLYVYSTTAIRFFALITPIGGVCFLVGWVFLFWQCLKL
jgi:uncharacterized membrane protein YgdD (TMEM256/DUF423 family)